MQRFAVLDCNGERKRVDAGLSWGWVALCTSLEARMEKKYVMRVRHGCSLEVAMSTGGHRTELKEFDYMSKRHRE